jgi:enoyl-CoA hydratase/carnithine racemase
MTDSEVIVEKSDGVLWARINRPSALNALNETVLASIFKVLDQIEHDQDIRVLVLTGTGRAFSVGLDIDCLTRGFEDHAYFRFLLAQVTGICRRIEESPVPVITAINGLARAGGFEMILASDFSFAASDAKIGDNHLLFSVMPGGGASQRAPLRLGTQRAKELIFTGRWMSAQEAAEAGLVLGHFPPQELEGAVTEFAQSMTMLSRNCLAATKRAMNKGNSMPLLDGIDLETALFFEYLDKYSDGPNRFKQYLRSRESEEETNSANS